MLVMDEMDDEWSRLGRIQKISNRQITTKVLIEYFTVNRDKRDSLQSTQNQISGKIMVVCKKYKSLAGFIEFLNDTLNSSSFTSAETLI